MLQVKDTIRLATNQPTNQPLSKVALLSVKPRIFTGVIHARKLTLPKRPRVYTHPKTSREASSLFSFPFSTIQYLPKSLAQFPSKISREPLCTWRFVFPHHAWVPSYFYSHVLLPFSNLSHVALKNRERIDYSNRLTVDLTRMMNSCFP